MTVLAVVLFVVLWILGLIATFIPIVPSSLIVWGAALVYAFLTGFTEIDVWWLIGLGVVALGASLLDNLAGAWGTRRYGGSKAAMIGALIGGVVGIVLGPIGILLGPLGGAFIGEFAFGDRAARGRTDPPPAPQVMPPPDTSAAPTLPTLQQVAPRLERSVASTKGTLLGLVLGVGAKLIVHLFMGVAVLVRIAF